MSKFFSATLVAALSLSSFAVSRYSAGQSPAPAPVAAPATSDLSQPYARPDLNMTYNPPAGWKTQDTTLVKAEGADAKTANCMKVLLSSTPESASQGLGGLSIGITVIDAARSCVAADMTPEAQLQSMVEATGKMPGLKPVKNASAYFIDGRTFWAMVAKGKPQLTDGTSSGTEIYVAMVGAVVKDHVVLWEMAAADLAMLQQMLNSTVQFTGKQPHILYKVNLK